MLQKTIKQSVECSGRGVHTGQKSKVVFSPASENSGICFIREDLPDQPRIKVQIPNVAGLERGTNLKKGEVEVFTVEHVLAALYGLDISNVNISVFGCELPVMDGSALEFVRNLKAAGIVEQSEPQPVFYLKQPSLIQEADSLLLALPAESLKITCIIEYPDNFVGTQLAKYSTGMGEFENEIAPARTYGFLAEVEALRKRGLGLGGSLENTVVIDKDKYLNPLRFPNELARHKILDLLGDLSLIGSRINANIISIKGGHKLNIELAKKFLSAEGGLYGS